MAAAVTISLAAPTTVGQRAAEEVPVQDESLSRWGLLDDARQEVPQLMLNGGTPKDLLARDGGLLQGLGGWWWNLCGLVGLQ